MYPWISAGVFIALFGVWSKNGGLNICVKLAMLGLGVWGLLVALH